jgi:predicted transcriptional regulator
MDFDLTKPMNGSEIAEKLGMTRQAVSYSIRKSMKKMYKRVINLGLADSPFQVILVLMEVLNVNSSVSDIKEFIKLFDKDIVDAVMADAKNIYNIK